MHLKREGGREGGRERERRKQGKEGNKEEEGRRKREEGILEGFNNVNQMHFVVGPCTDTERAIRDLNTFQGKGKLTAQRSLNA